MSNVRRAFRTTAALVVLFALALQPLSAGVRAADETGEWAHVVSVVAPHMVRVQNDVGETFVVWHIGLIGPPADETDEALYDQALQAHADLLPTGTSVWLQPESGVVDPDPGVRLRHVFTAADLQTPVGASLLQAGWVRVYPNALHTYADTYATQQADAVLARAGAWAESGATTVFVPRGAPSGGLPSSRRLLTALQILDADATGHQVLLEVNRFPVTVEVQRLPADAFAGFSNRMYSIQLSTSITPAEPESLAAELLHELTHAQQVIRANLFGETLDCYTGELESARAAARYWSSVYGPDGKLRLTSPLDAWLNHLLAMYQSGVLETEVRSRYHEQCDEQGSWTGL